MTVLNLVQFKDKTIKINSIKTKKVTNIHKVLTSFNYLSSCYTCMVIPSMIKHTIMQKCNAFVITILKNGKFE